MIEFNEMNETDEQNPPVAENEAPNNQTIGINQLQEADYANLIPASDPTGYETNNIVAPPPNGYEQNDDIVQVVYQSEQNGSLVGIGASLLSDGSAPATFNDETTTSAPQYATIEHDRSRIDTLESTTDNQENRGQQLIDLGPLETGPALGDAESNGSCCELKEDMADIQEEIGDILVHHTKGAAESGSFRQNNFRKKLGLSASTNENDLTAHRQKFLESREVQATGASERLDSLEVIRDNGSDADNSNNPNKFKRTHSVSFNMGFSRSNRHSVDIRNLPSYLTHKRASIVDVARGAMSSLISSLSGGGGGGSSSGPGSSIGGASQRRDSWPAPLDEEEPIFEEPIAPTLSLGQRVAMVRNSGAEFGTVGWIGQLPGIEDDWIVGVIFDNMIGNCDGAYMGIRYFYARANYAMFVPLSLLTRTDNYIGRPETGTMLSRMSISLKPGQLISIQRSSIRLQHCFLNAPHQRVGHDVRAVSNRLHCQCHNCGPCAHLTKQGRAAHQVPHFGAKHLSHHKKNSLAHAAVELLAHHHHHFHDEEEEHHEEKDYQFGDNAAHACNYVRYSCCQQNGVAGHEFMHDCAMVRPELLDNLIHAPKAPHRRSRPRRSRAPTDNSIRAAPCAKALELQPEQAGAGGPDAPATLISNQSWTLDGTTNNNTLQSSLWLGSNDATGRNARSSSYSSGTSPSRSPSSRSSSRSSRSSGSSSSSSSSGARSPRNGTQSSAAYMGAAETFHTDGAYNTTIDSQFSIMDQKRFIYQRNSTAEMVQYQPSYQSDDQISQATPTGCFNCFKRKDRHRHKSKRKLSARDRVLEYRRRQSTFVPSTLAKPQEDFASHGIILPSTSAQATQAAAPVATDGHNSDYSSYSVSSASSSSSSSSSLDSQGNFEAIKRNQSANDRQPQQEEQQQQQAMGNIEHGSGGYGAGGQLKSSQAGHYYDNGTPEVHLNYTDYSFDEQGDSLLKKRDSSKDSALTDLGYSETYKTSHSSSDTLKQLVDQSVNEQIGLPGIREDPIMSPILSLVEECQPTSEQLDISSPTASLAEYANEEARRGLEDLMLDHYNADNEDYNYQNDDVDRQDQS